MFAVLHLPDFALQAVLRQEPELWSRPVALIDPEQTAPRVIQLTPAARAAGVAEGLTPVQALARCREVLVRHRSPAREAAVTDAVLQVAYGFSPHLESTAPGTVTIDLRGLSELTAETPAAGPPIRLQAWASRLRNALRALGLNARLGTGPTPNVARHAARWTDGLALVDDATAFIASLPVAALGPSAHVAGILHKWGVTTVGELLALGQAELAERFGLEAFALWAAAAAGTVRPLHLVRPAETFAERFDYDPPIETLEPLLFLLRRLVDQLGRRLEGFGFVAATLVLTLRLESGVSLERRLHVPQPTRATDVLFRMLQTHLESVRGDSPVVGVALLAEPTRPTQRQFGLFEAALRDPHQFQETLARLSALVGADRVGTPVRADTHRPDTFRLLPPDFENAPSPVQSRVPALRRQVPVRRLRPPLPANVVTGGPADAPPATPVTIRCAVAQGQLRLAAGPFRSSGAWWEPAAWTREEWDAETLHGETVRLVRRDGGWFVEGLLD